MERDTFEKHLNKNIEKVATPVVDFGLKRLATCFQTFKLQTSALPKPPTCDATHSPRVPTPQNRSRTTLE
jgi:hypothetical protein